MLLALLRRRSATFTTRQNDSRHDPTLTGDTVSALSVGRQYWLVCLGLEIYTVNLRDRGCVCVLNLQKREFAR